MEAEPINTSGAPPVQQRPSGSSQNQGERNSATPSASSVDLPDAADTVTLSNEGKQAATTTSGNSNQTGTGGQNGEPVVPQTRQSQSNDQRKVEVTDDSQVVLQIVDSVTGEVVKQIPPEEQIKLTKAIQNTIDDLAKNNNQGQLE